MGLEVYGKRHPATLMDHANLAAIYRAQERWSEAEEVEQNALEAAKEVLGEEHPTTLTMMNNLAFTLQAQGRHE